MTGEPSTIARLTTQLAEVEAALSCGKNELDALVAVVRLVQRFEPERAQLFTPAWGDAHKPAELEIACEWTRAAGASRTPLHRRPTLVHDLPLPVGWIEHPTEILAVGDIEQDPRCDLPVRRQNLLQGTRALVLLPLFSRIHERWQGLVTLAWGEVHPVSEEERFLYVLIRQTLAAALAHRQAERSMRMAMNEMSLFYTVGDELNAAPTLAAALEAAAIPAVSRGATTAHLTVLQRDEGGAARVGVLAAGVDLEGASSPIPIGQRFELDSAPLGRLWIERPQQPLLIGDVETDDRVDPLSLSRFRTAQQRAVVVLPLLSQDRLIGALSFSWPAAQSFSERDSRLYKTIARASATSFENRLLMQQMQKTMHENAEQAKELIAAQAAALAERSTPLIPISSEVMVVPLIGSLDGERGEQLLHVVLEGVAATPTRVFIIDVTGAHTLDTEAASCLSRVAQALRLLGVEPVLTGIRAEAARNLIHVGIGLEGIITRNTLQSGLTYALGRTGRKWLE